MASAARAARRRAERAERSPAAHVQAQARLRSAQGSARVLLSRLEALEAALRAEPQLSEESKFEYDRVLRGAQKLARLIGED